MLSASDMQYDFIEIFRDLLAVFSLCLSVKRERERLPATDFLFLRDLLRRELACFMVIPGDWDICLGKVVVAWCAETSIWSRQPGNLGKHADVRFPCLRFSSSRRIRIEVTKLEFFKIIINSASWSFNFATQPVVFCLQMINMWGRFNDLHAPASIWNTAYFYCKSSVWIFWCLLPRRGICRMKSF